MRFSMLGRCQNENSNENSNSKYNQIPTSRRRRNEKLEIRMLQNPKQVPIFIISGLFLDGNESEDLNVVMRGFLSCQK